MRRYFIDYPQEEDQGMYDYRCRFCKMNTRIINGLVENHRPDCEYRQQKLSQPHIPYHSCTPHPNVIDAAD